jgi:flagellar biosynthesis component FlhA
MKAIFLENADHLLTYQQVKALLEQAKQGHEALINEVIPHRFSILDVKHTLSQLLQAGISIRNVNYILERMAYWASQNFKIEDTSQKLLDELKEVPR